MATEILLIAIADEGLDSIKSEIGGLRGALKKAQTNGDIKLRNNSYTDYDSLDVALCDQTDGRSITMLHYAGHSTKKGFLVHDGKTLGLEALRSLIDTHGKFRFIFLNSCFSEAIAQQFQEIGVPYVIGTEGKIGDNDAALVASKFYEILGSSPITIKDAYHKTLTYFSEHTNELKENGEFRGALETGTEAAKNVWKLVFDEGKLAESQKNWTLIPDYKQALKNTNDSSVLKVLGLYQKNDDKYFQKIKNTHTKEGIVIHGVWDIFGDKDFDKAIFEEEFKPADAVLHLIGSVDFLAEPFNYVFGDLETKKNAWLPLTDGLKEDSFVSVISAFKRFQKLTPNIPVLGDSLREILDNIRYNDLEKALRFFEESLRKFLDDNSINIEEIKGGFKRLSFTEKSVFEKNFREKENTFFNLITIGSSSDCGCPLLVRQIIGVAKAANSSNVKIKTIDFKAVDTSLDLWNLMAERLNLGKDDDIDFQRKSCKKTIIKRLKTRMDNIEEDMNVYIVCENLKEALIAEIESLFVDLDNDASSEPFVGKLLFFIITNDRSFPQSLEEFVSPVKVNKHLYKKIAPMLSSDIEGWGKRELKYSKKIMAIHDPPISNIEELINIFPEGSDLRRRGKFIGWVWGKLSLDSMTLNNFLTYNYD